MAAAFRGHRNGNKSIEIGDITRFPTAKKLCRYIGLCPRVHQSGESDRRGPLTKQVRIEGRGSR